MSAATIYIFSMMDGSVSIDLSDPTAYAVEGNRDLAFDKDTGRFILVNGNFSFTKGIDAIRQGIEIRLQFFLGEWFLDTSKGMPYYQRVLVKNPSIPGVRALFREHILKAPGVRSVTSLELTFNKSARRLSVDWTADTDAGEITGTTARVI